MTKAEQEWSLIEALEYCKGKRLLNKCCAGCPYAGVGCAIDVAISKLNAQEPRVMTLDEVKMLDSDYYYLESMRSPGKELREIVGAYGLTCVTWPSITWARQTMGDSGYAKTWRCWTSRPTDEQREATPWK
jgi:hypothetical protein